MSNQLVELGLSDEHQIGRQYQKVNQPTPRDPTRLQVAMYFDGAANDAIDDLELWMKYWGQFYDPAVLKSALVALKAIKDLVNR